MILVINICKEKLHYLEFVKPIEDILKKNKMEYSIVNYKDIKEEVIKKAKKIIICGTSLKDNDFIGNLKYFSWIKDKDKPVLGICGGMQIIGLIFGGAINYETEIGYYPEKFKQDFLGLNGNIQVYHLHNNYIDFSKLSEFIVFCSSGKISQAIKHKDKEIYGVLFHPEVRNKEMIVNFLKLK
jgi:GMP synthase-like glutamine amidotransferase